MEDPQSPPQCPYRVGRTTVICCTAGKLMVPSIEERQKYCEDGFTQCPHYKEAKYRTMYETTNGMAAR